MSKLEYSEKCVSCGLTFGIEDLDNGLCPKCFHESALETVKAQVRAEVKSEVRAMIEETMINDMGTVENLQEMTYFKDGYNQALSDLSNKLEGK